MGFLIYSSSTYPSGHRKGIYMADRGCGRVVANLQEGGTHCEHTEMFLHLGEQEKVESPGGSFSDPVYPGEPQK